MRLSRSVLKAFAADKHCLASLADEGSAFDREDPEDEQLIRALSRFAHGVIKILTRDEMLREHNPCLTISQQQCLQHKTVNVIDFKTQQDQIRPALDNITHRVLRDGQYIMVPEVRKLEERLAEYQVNNRDLVQQRLNENSVPTAVHYPVPLRMQTASSYLNQAAGSFPVVEAAGREVLSLPHLSEDAMTQVARILRTKVK